MGTINELIRNLDEIQQELEVANDWEVVNIAKRVRSCHSISFNAGVDSSAGAGSEYYAETSGVEREESVSEYVHHQHSHHAHHAHHPPEHEHENEHASSHARHHGGALSRHPITSTEEEPHHAEEESRVRAADSEHDVGADSANSETGDPHLAAAVIARNPLSVAASASSSPMAHHSSSSQQPACSSASALARTTAPPTYSTTPAAAPGSTVGSVAVSGDGATESVPSAAVAGEQSVVCAVPPMGMSTLSAASSASSAPSSPSAMKASEEVHAKQQQPPREERASKRASSGEALQTIGSASPTRHRSRKSKRQHSTGKPRSRSNSRVERTKKHSRNRTRVRSGSSVDVRSRERTRASTPT
jgi:hypothetical protein